MTLKDINFNIAMYGTEPVVQSTYSVVYTGDESSVKVNFNVTDDEADLTGATAKVHLYFADSSHIERDAQIDGTVVHYTLKGTENDHAGPVRVDVFITMNGATYTRAGYKFRIDASLEASAPLVEYAIETLDTVVKDADEWLAQAKTDFGTAQNQRAAEWVADNDMRDDQFTAAQVSRTESFGQSETARTAAFNTSETGRSNTFTTNENARQAAADANETARNNSYTVAENNREERYGIAESNRSETADADHTRAVGDHNTATADHGIAESDHVTATADHENYAGLLEDGVLTTQIVDKLTKLETTYAPDLVSVKQQLAEADTRIDGIVTSAGDYYLKCLQTDTGALLVVASGAIAGQINLASVSPRLDTFTPIAGDYVRLVSNGLTAELIDTRIGNDGVVNPTAGGSVRRQIFDLANLNGMNWDRFPYNKGYTNAVNIVFETGNLDATGNDLASAVRIRTKLFGADEAFSLYTPVFKYRLFTFSSAGVFETATDYTLGSYNAILAPNKLYRMVFATEVWGLPDITVLKQQTIAMYGDLQRHLLDLLSSDAIVINAVSYGFNNTGIGTDNDAIMTAYIAEHGRKKLYFPAGIYRFSNNIIVPDGCDWELASDAIILRSPYSAFSNDPFIMIKNPNRYRGLKIKGGTIDAKAKNRVGVGLYDNYYFEMDHVTVKNATVRGVSTYHVTYGTGHGITLDTCYIWNETFTASEDSYGIYDGSYDNNFRDCVTRNFKFGMLCGGGATVTRVHPWLEAASMIPGSCAFVIEHDSCELDGCIADTYQRAVMTRNASNDVIVTATNLRFFINTQVYTPAVAVTSPPRVFHAVDFGGGNICYPLLHVHGVSINTLPYNVELFNLTYPTELLSQIWCSGVTNTANITNDSFTADNRLRALEMA